MKEIHLTLEEKKPRFGIIPFPYFEPNYTDVNELYRVNDEPINIINNSENVPFIQNVAQQQLVDISSDSLDTSSLSDQQIAAATIPRYVDINEIADAGRNSLNELYNVSSIKNE